MKTQHTPGPWRKQSGVTYISVIDGNNRPILHNASPEVGVSREEHEANASLIAAAPDLLEALEAMRQKYGKLHDFLSDCIENGRLTEAEIPDDYQAISGALCECLEADTQAGTAIAKAKGE
jgi:hypothetical protein